MTLDVGDPDPTTGETVLTLTLEPLTGLAHYGAAGLHDSTITYQLQCETQDHGTITSRDYDIKVINECSTLVKTLELNEPAKEVAGDVTVSYHDVISFAVRVDQVGPLAQCGLLVVNSCSFEPQD